MDFRREWFKNRILLYFGETDADILDNFLRRDDNRMEKQFQAFLNDSPQTIDDVWKQVFVVYRTYYSRMVEEEVEVQEEVTKQRSSSMFGQDDKKKDKKGKKKKKGKKVARIEEEDDEDGDADVYADLQDPYYEALLAKQEEDDKRGRKKKKFGKSGRSSPSTMMENVPASERRGKSQMVTSYVTVKKKIQKVVQVPQLRGYFGIIQNDVVDPQNSYVYFIKKLSRAVPQYSSMEETNTKIPEFFVIGSLTGTIFENLYQLLNTVYFPLVQNQIFNHTPENDALTGEVEEENVELEGIKLERRSSWYFMRKHIEQFEIPKDEFQTTSKSSLAEQLKYFIYVDEQKSWRELLDRLIDLINAIQWAQNELQSERKFSVLESLSQIENENAEVNEEMLQLAKDTVEGWIQQIETSLTNQTQNAVAGLDLLSEYEYWKKEAIKLSSAIDELHAPATTRVVNILKMENASILDEFEKKRNSLELLYCNTKETAEVLYTLRYFFKILTFGHFVSITKIVPTMVDSLQSVWILSKHYGDEKNMERILINIKSTLCHRVKSSFDVTSLFRSTYAELNDKFQSAIDMLRTWKSSYLEIRARIECNRDYFITRWEFDKSKLFAETDYIGTIIWDLKKIFEIIQQFRSLLDSTFKKLMNSTDLKTIEEKVANLSTPIEKVDFDIYLEIFRDEWQEVLEIFEENVIEVDQRLKLLIIKTFSQIRSVKEGIEIVDDISKIKTRQTVLDSVPYISNKIIAQFAKEVKITDQIFDRNKSNGEDTYKIYELVQWARKLVENLRKTLLQLELVAALSTTSQFNDVKCQFDVFSKKVDNYVATIYKEWKRKVINLINEMFKDNVIEIEEAEKSVDLKKIKEIKRPQQLRTAETTSTMPTAATYRDRELGLGALTFTLKWIAKSKITTADHVPDQNMEMSKRIEKAHKLSWLEFVDNQVLIERGFQFRLKLKNEIFDIVKDAEYLRDEGFPLSEEIRDLLVLKLQLFEKIEYIRRMVAEYNALVSELEPAQILLMKQHLLDTEMAIQPGLTWYTWKSTVLDTYCAKATTKLQQFVSLHYQMRQIFNKLNDFVASIETMNFFPMQGDNLANMRCKEFFHTIDVLQNEEVEECVRTGEMISLALIQLESLVQYTSTGRSTLMVYFYDAYEEKISTALKRAVLESISSLERLFNGELNIHFSIKLYLENGNLKLQPSCDELQELVKITINRIFSRLRKLKRWKRGSCIVDREDNQFFYQILRDDKQIEERNSVVLGSVQILCESLTQSAEKWLKYSMLWKYDKNAKIAEFASKNPQLNDYEIQFDFYSNIVSKIEDEKPINAVFYVNIDVSELMNQLKIHCTEWKHGLGRQLSLDTMQIILRIERTIKRLSHPLNVEITDIENLTNALTSINEIQQMETDTQIEFYKIQEHYHELRMQNLKLSAQDLTRFDKLKHDWELLSDRALYKQFVLEPAKMAMSDVMSIRITQFEKECQKFLTAYAADKEKLISSDFDTCVELITKFSELCSNLYDRKLTLENIHECYEIQPIKFDDFLKTKSELELLKAKFLI